MSELFLVDNNQIIDLYEIKLSDFEGYFYFHGSKNFKKDIVFKGVKYLYIPTELDNLSYDSEGKQNRPVVKISNANNFITNLISDRADLLGKDFHRKKILSKDLDDENFGGVNKGQLGISNFRDFIAEDKFKINKKNLENKERVEFELSNILDIDGLTCPSRKVYNNSCPWQYRGHGCNYGKRANYNGPNIILNSIDDNDAVYNSLFNLLKPDTGNGSLGLENNLVSWFTGDGYRLSTERTKRINDAGIPLNRDDSEENGRLVIAPFNTQSEKLEYTVDPQNFSSTTEVERSGLESWFNMAKYINIDNYTAVTGDLVFDSLQTEAPSIVYSQLIMNRQRGFNFTKTKAAEGQSETSRNIPAYIPKNFNNEDLTVVYVVRPTNTHYPKFLSRQTSSEAPYGGIVASAMVTQDKSTYLGWKGNRNGDAYNIYPNPTANTFQIKSTANLIQGGTSPALAINTPFIYSASIPGSHGGTGSFYYNGVKIASMTMDYGGSGQSHSINNLGFNFDTDVYSDIEVYEMLVFNTLLSEDQIIAVNNYLGRRFGIDTGEVGNTYRNFSSASIFGDEEGNLGIPLADENDKLFFDEVRGSSKFWAYESYNLKKLAYKGDYNKNTSYIKGDFVKIDPEINFDFNRSVLTQDSELASRFFICVSENGSKGINPLDRTDIWVEDKCSKKLSGCLIRFRNETSNDRIPFGGFPGTVDYAYNLPQS